MREKIVDRFDETVYEEGIFCKWLLRSPLMTSACDFHGYVWDPGYS